ncbi:MAG TPA: hypothetical protein VLV29_08640 [Steroidobacteraceae bacterium]|nr:hypothetical protein [Steroidobacteraceae bacterium]
MPLSKPIVLATLFLLGLMLLAPGCVVEPREGYYDRDHHRWYHEHAWHDCVVGDLHCH